MDLKELIAALKGMDKKKVADALKAEAPDHYQTIYQRGFSTSNTEAKTKLEAKDDQISKLTEEGTAKDQEIATLKDGQPDLAKLEDGFKSQIADLETKNEKLAADLQTERTGRSTDKDEAASGRFLDRVVNRLVRNHGVHQKYAEKILRLEISDRVKVKHLEDGSRKVQVMDAEGLAPLQAEADKLVETFATSLVPAIDTDFITVDGDKGGGADDGDKGGGADKWDKYRKRAEEAAGNKPDSVKKLDEKFGAKKD